MSYDDFPDEFRQIRRHIEDENFVEAEKVLQLIVRKLPDFQQARLDLERVQGKKGSISNYEFRVQGFLDEGNLDQARQILAEARQKFPKNPRITMLIESFTGRIESRREEEAPEAPSFSALPNPETVITDPPPEVVETLRKLGMTVPDTARKNPKSASGGGSSNFQDPFERSQQQQAAALSGGDVNDVFGRNAREKAARERAEYDAAAARESSNQMPTRQPPQSPQPPQSKGQPQPKPRPQPQPQPQRPQPQRPQPKPAQRSPHTTQHSPDATQLPVNMPDELAQWVKQQAAREKISPSALMRRLAREYRRFIEQRQQSR